MRGVPTLFIAHQLDLIYDAKKIFEEFLTGVGEIGVIGGGECTYRPLTVACIDSLANKLNDPTMLRYLREKVKYVIVDETQFYGKGQYSDVLEQCNAPYRVFMSATVERSDGADLEIECQSGPMMFSLTEEEMIDENYISEVSVEMIPFDHKLYNAKATGIKYPEFYQQFIVDNTARNELIVAEIKKLVDEGHPTLSIVRIIEHGHILKAMLADVGIHAEFVFGDVTPAKRIQLRDEFNRGDYDVIIGSTVFDVGISLHRASGLVLAAGGSSKIRSPQRIGRVLSSVMGKVAIVKDIKDQNIKYFDDDAKDRQSVYVERYGQKRVKVRGSGPKTEEERIAGVDYMAMFDKLF